MTVQTTTYNKFEGGVLLLRSGDYLLLRDGVSRVVLSHASGVSIRHFPTPTWAADQFPATPTWTQIEVV